MCVTVPEKNKYHSILKLTHILATPSLYVINKSKALCFQFYSTYPPHHNNSLGMSLPHFLALLIVSGFLARSAKKKCFHDETFTRNAYYRYVIALEKLCRDLWKTLYDTIMTLKPNIKVENRENTSMSIFYSTNQQTSFYILIQTCKLNLLSLISTSRATRVIDGWLNNWF